mmetsp:Transcript_53849/g.140964  ORF Transcript_53849/g.140964 Transcript_53849/m.140964 type:complete len:97 (+) Transcript_53849:1-291(+)
MGYYVPPSLRLDRCWANSNSLRERWLSRCDDDEEELERLDNTIMPWEAVGRGGKAFPACESHGAGWAAKLRFVSSPKSSTPCLSPPSPPPPPPASD